MGAQSGRETVVWRDNVKPPDFEEWEAIVAATLEPYAGHFGVGFYETSAGWSFTTGWLDVIGVEGDARGVRAAGDPGAIRRPLHQALTRAGKPLAEDAHVRARDPDADAPAPEERLTDAQVDALANLTDPGGTGTLIRRLAAEVHILREEIRKARSAAPGR